MPKQYCSFVGGQSLLEDALARCQQLVRREHVVTVVAREHEPFWRRGLRRWSRQNVVVQPRNRGTAPGLLLPLMAVAARDPEAQVMVMPSDHFVADEAVFVAALRRAQETSADHPDRLLVVGIEPDGPEVDYGWILPGAFGRGVQEVRRFVEKPDRTTARTLFRAGAVWNSFLLVGAARVFLGLYAEHLPRLLAAFLSAEVAVRPANADGLYETLGDADFCRDLLAGAEASLGLCVAPACGWTDLGVCATSRQPHSNPTLRLACGHSMAG